MDPHEAVAGRRPARTPTAFPTIQLLASQQAALAEVMTGIDADTRWVLLLGPNGSGKSTVLRALLDELRLAAATVAVIDARETADVDDLAGSLHEQLGLPHKRKYLGGDHSISEIVAHQSAARTPLVVVVDDADALSSANVKWLAGLAASGSQTETQCYVVLAGTLELEDSAGPAWARWGSGRDSVRCILETLTSAEVRRYVDQWRSSRGDGWIKFTDAAIQRIEMYSQGRPKLIGELCAGVITLPGTRLSEQVSAEAVMETAERLGLGRPVAVSLEREQQIEPRPRRRLVGWAALVIGTAALAALLGSVGLSRVGPRLIETSTTWLGFFVSAVDRSTSDVARSRKEDARREPRVAPGRAREETAPTPPTIRPVRAQRAVELPQRAAPVEPSAQQIAALMTRARDGEVGELTRLISSGVSPNVRDVGGFTPLMAAVVADQVPAARALLDRGAEINARARGGMTALMLAVINDRPDTLKLLLERGAEIDAQSGAGWTALTFAVWKGDAALVKTLLSHGAKPNVRDKQGWTPLDYAPPKLPPTDPGPDTSIGGERGSTEAISPPPTEPH